MTSIKILPSSFLPFIFLPSLPPFSMLEALYMLSKISEHSSGEPDILI